MTFVGRFSQFRYPSSGRVNLPANDLISYPKITIADFDIPHLSAPSQPKRSDAPGNVFVAPLTLSGATL